MTALLVLPMGLALAAVAPGLGWAAQLLLTALLAVMLGTGQLICRLLGCRDEPFLALVVGFVLLAHALVLGDLVVPGAHWTVAAAFAIPAAAGFLWGRPACGRVAMGVAVMAALFTLIWNLDVAPRLATFYATGFLDFWLDVLVHAASLAQFSAPHAIDRGMVLLADTPAPLYHYASYLPSALLTTVTGTPPLDATVLAWIPLGILVMACGVAALGYTLGGPGLAVLSLAALAFLPAPERLTQGNGFLGFAWLLETAPGTPYSLGIACAALAVLVRWVRDQRLRSLLLALGLTAGCFLVRANTFIWLAPAVALGTVAGWRRPGPRVRFVLVGLSVLALVELLAALSWPALRADPVHFLFGYIEFVHLNNGPTHFDGLYPALVQHLGHVGAGVLGIGLTLVGTLGPWFPAFVILGLLVRRRLEPADTLPVIVLGVAALAMLIAPMARNGDITEFRQRAGPMLVAVVAVWSLRFAAILTAPLLQLMPARGRGLALGGVAALSLGVLTVSIDPAKRPTMAWGAEYYHSHVAPELFQLAPLLARTTESRPRFAVADQPSDARSIDDAARLVALSGVPAYISCPAFLLVTGGQIGAEAQRRMAVLARLDAAPSLAELQQIMRAERITHYVVTTEHDAAFDPERRAAFGRAGSYAIYLAGP